MFKKKEYKYITVWQEGDDDIIFGNYSPNLEVTLEIAKEMVQNRLDFAGEKKHYVIVDFSNVKSSTKEARDYMSTPEGGLKGILGGAFLSSNALSNLFVNLYLKINKPKVPAKFFTTKQEAINWLRQLKSEI